LEQNKEKRWLTFTILTVLLVYAVYVWGIITMTRLEQVAWELYQQDTRGLALSADFWDELGRETQQQYMKRAEKMIAVVGIPQGRCAGPHKDLGLFNEDCLAIDCRGYQEISRVYGRECGNCRRWRRVANADMDA
jgi:hypothetical protein